MPTRSKRSLIINRSPLGGAGWLTIDYQTPPPEMRVFAVFLLALSASCPANAEPSAGPSPASITDVEARKHALRLLCPIAQKAGGGWVMKASIKALLY